MRFCESGEILSKTCDCCKSYSEHEIEMQEFTSIKFKTGYDSIFGDGNLVECDICQHCLEKYLGKFLRITYEN